MSELMPCPFCGDEVHIHYESDAKAFSVWHKHDKCKFIETMWISGDDAKSLNEAYRVWNERAGRECQDNLDKIKEARDKLLRLRHEVGYIRKKDIEDAFKEILE